MIHLLKQINIINIKKKKTEDLYILEWISLVNSSNNNYD